MQKIQTTEKALKGTQKWRTSVARLSHGGTRVAVLRPFWCASVALLALSVAGCLPPATREDVQRDWDKSVTNWQTIDWHDMASQMTGLDLHDGHDLLGQDSTVMSDDDRVLCLNQNSEERVVSENGVSDHVNYRRCPVSPYPTNVGERLSPGHIDPIELNNPLN